MTTLPHRIGELVFVCVIGISSVAEATVGMAEWTLETPGGNVICRADPYLEEHDTCLRAADPPPGTLQDPEIYISHVDRWRFYDHYVAGKTSDSFFLFDERDKSIAQFDSEAELDDALKTLEVGQPTSTWLEPGDGWNSNWRVTLPESGIYHMWADQSVERLGEARREELRRELNCSPPELPAKLFFHSLKDYSLELPMPTLENLRFLSDEMDLSALQRELTETAAAIRTAGDPTNPMISYLLERADQLTTNKNPYADSILHDEMDLDKAEFVRKLEMTLCLRVLTAHAESKTPQE
jgi:hypothetical protein